MCLGWPIDPREVGKKILNETEIQWVNEHFDQTISEKLTNYIDDVVFKKSRYMIYTREKKKYIGYCTYCNQHHEFEWLKHNNDVRCPGCFSLCAAKSAGVSRGKMRDVAKLTVYDKSSKDPKVVVARAIYVVKDFRSDYKNVETQYNIEAWYIFEINKLPFMATPAWGGRVERRASAYSLYDKPNYTYGTSSEIETYFPEWSLKDAIKDTPFEYCDYSKCPKENAYPDDYISYMGVFCEIPKIEYFVKQGLTNLVKAKINKEPIGRLVKWKAASLEKALGISMQEFKEIRKHEHNISVKFLNLFKDNKANKWALDTEQVFRLSQEIRYQDSYDRFKNLAKQIPGRQLFNYVIKQMSLNPKRYATFSLALSDYNDYLEDCKKLNMALDQDVIKHPKNLNEAHQETIKRIKYVADKALTDKFKKRAKALKKMEMTYKGLMIVIPKSPKDIIDEGTALSHCVGRYSKDHAEGKTTILFVRDIKKPNKSLCTIEVRANGTIAQCRGFENKEPNERVKSFVKRFEENNLANKTKRKTVQEGAECRI